MTFGLRMVQEAYVLLVEVLTLFNYELYVFPCRLA